VEAKIASVLLVYGPLGVICILSLLFAWKKDRDLAKERVAFQNRIDDQSKAHHEELQTLQERFITKAETWMSKYGELATSMTAVLESFERKYPRR